MCFLSKLTFLNPLLLKTVFFLKSDLSQTFITYFKFFFAKRECATQSCLHMKLLRWNLYYSNIMRLYFSVSTCGLLIGLGKNNLKSWNFLAIFLVKYVNIVSFKMCTLLSNWISTHKDFWGRRYWKIFYAKLHFLYRNQSCNRGLEQSLFPNRRCGWENTIFLSTAINC